MDLAYKLFEDVIFSAIAALGFAFLFNVPVRTLPVCALLGAIGHGLRTFLMDYFGLGIEASAFIGATTVGLLGEYFSHKVHTPAPVFTIVGVIPMVPGKFAFSTMMGIIKLTYAHPDTSNSIVAEAMTNGIKTGLILVGLGVGIAVPNLVFKRIRP